MTDWAGFNTVFAASQSSPWKSYGPVFGYEYENQAMVRVDSNGACAFTLVQSDGSGNIPVGYMGAQAKLWTSDGYCVYASSWDFNDAVIYGFNVSTGYQNDEGYYYYSKGETAAYNGNGYSDYDTYQTPNIT